MRKFFDLHNDFLTKLKNDKRRTRYLSNFFEANQIVAAVFTSEFSSEDAMKFIENGFAFVEKNNSSICQNYQCFLHLGIEDLHFLTKSNLAKVINFAPKYCTLTWNEQNNLAGGAKEGGNITSFGEYVISELENNNIFVDTAHLCEQSFMTFSKQTSRPILCSHTAVRSLVNHERNLKDYQIKMIVESGGLMGIAFVDSFLSADGKSTVSDIARHIDYVISRFGDDNICLGTDFYGTKKTPKGVKSYSNLGAIEDRLAFLGYSQETIDKIFYKNAERFFSGF